MITIALNSVRALYSTCTYVSLHCNYLVVSYPEPSHSPRESREKCFFRGEWEGSGYETSD